MKRRGRPTGTLTASECVSLLTYRYALIEADKLQHSWYLKHTSRRCARVFDCVHVARCSFIQNPESSVTFDRRKSITAIRHSYRNYPVHWTSSLTHLRLQVKQMLRFRHEVTRLNWYWHTCSAVCYTRFVFKILVHILTRLLWHVNRVCSSLHVARAGRW